MTVTIKYRPPGTNAECGASGDGLREAFEELADAIPVMSVTQCGNPDCESANIKPSIKQGEKDGRSFSIPCWRCNDCGSNLTLHTTKDGKGLYTKWDDKWWVPDKKSSQDPPI